MNYSELHEDKKRGTFDFPIELYYVEPERPVFTIFLLMPKRDKPLE